MTTDDYVPDDEDILIAYRFKSLGLMRDPNDKPHDPEAMAEADAEYRRWIVAHDARIAQSAGRAAMLAFVAEAEKYRDLREASDDRHSAQDVDGWWYVISAADEHIAEFHPDPEEASE